MPMNLSRIAHNRRFLAAFSDGQVRCFPPNQREVSNSDQLLGNA